MKYISAVIISSLVLATGPAAAATPPLTVVELFQSQGCSDCPPANANVMALSDRPDQPVVRTYMFTHFGTSGWYVGHDQTTAGR